MKQRWIIILLGFLVALSLGLVPIQAMAVDVILAETSGLDNASTPDYYGVHYLPGGTAFIRSVSFDLGADPDGFFDFDGVDSFDNQTAPVLYPILFGLNPGDITFTLENFIAANHPQTVKVTFAPGSFGPGDSFHFAADTDDFNQPDPIPGGVFGLKGNNLGIFSAELESGQSASAQFIELYELTSGTAVAFCPCPPVPVPPALLLFGSGLLGVWGLQRRQKNI